MYVIPSVWSPGCDHSVSIGNLLVDLQGRCVSFSPLFRFRPSSVCFKVIYLKHFVWVHACALRPMILFFSLVAQLDHGPFGSPNCYYPSQCKCMSLGTIAYKLCFLDGSLCSAMFNLICFFITILLICILYSDRSWVSDNVFLQVDTVEINEPWTLNLGYRVALTSTLERVIVIRMKFPLCRLPVCEVY